MIIVVTAVIVGLITFWLGHGHANYRHARTCRSGHRRPSLFASLGRGPFVWGSVPVGGGFRLGHRL